MRKLPWLTLVTTAAGVGLGVTYALVWGCDSG
jgi:hypothetical protein